jgi:competence protein ComEC
MVDTRTDAVLPQPWQSPFLLLTGAVTAGIVADRFSHTNLALDLAVVTLGLAAWAFSFRRQKPEIAIGCLLLVSGGLGAAYHHFRHDVFAADDIGWHATPEARPIQARGVLDEEPAILAQQAANPLTSVPHGDSTVAVISVSQIRSGDDWHAASGRARLTVAGHLHDIHGGDEVEIVGRLIAPRRPENPGEADYAGFLQDRGIRALIVVAKTRDGVTRLHQTWPGTVHGWVGFIRGWGARSLANALPPEQSGLAAALLLGEGTAMTSAEWEKYIRTGVIHVLAISGQHLAILAGFFWWVQRLLHTRRRHFAIFVGLFLVGYALLTGGQPPATRAAVMVGVECLAFLVGRQPWGINSLALAWLMVAAINPTDIFGAGCQLSFISVALLNLGIGQWFRRDLDPLERLFRKSQPRWERTLRDVGRKLATAYATTLFMWLILAPLVATHYHLVSPVGILIGPPVIILSALALIAGFLLLLAAFCCSPLVPLLAIPTRFSLAGCDWLVRAAEQTPFAYWYVPDLPNWWVIGVYLGLIGVLLSESLRRAWRSVCLAGLGWAVLGLLILTIRPSTDELRCTFLAVGHGGCTVLETPDGRTLLYDTGSLSGPDVTRRQIAPYLWQRGIRRIDEVFISHADLDHFNGLLDLAARFSIGQVTCTPTFAGKETESTRLTLVGLEQRRIPMRVVHAGARLAAESVTIDVLHPPANGPEGNENTRSLVLLIRHAGHTVLLTGDLEGAGQRRILAMSPPAVDVLMAPHHGSAAANGLDLAVWARPRVVISCESAPRGPTRPAEPYSAHGAHFFGTWPHGAITLRSHASGLILETFASKQQLVIRRGG